MSELRRYGMNNWGVIAKDDRGAYVQFEDVSSRLQQLEQEKATLQSQNDELRYYNKAYIETLGVSQDQRVAELSAALAETREALHQLQEKYAKLDQLVRMTLKMASTTDVSDVSSEEFNAMDELATSLGYVVP